MKYGIKCFINDKPNHAGQWCYQPNNGIKILECFETLNDAYNRKAFFWIDNIAYTYKVEEMI